ncbi:MAG: DUF1285 domain-containing protein [Rhodospirillales bacterium]|nr:DUF1285 domain-containing protein [Rhodospirillales bacterium]
MRKHTPQVDASLHTDSRTDGGEMCFPPVKLNGRDFRGDLDIRIDAHGRWHYNQSRIERKTMVCLFASMLMLDARGRHWLVTPTELGRIEVEDAPFIAVDMFVCGEGRDQVISFCTNVDSLVSVEAATPLSISESPASGELVPYVTDERSLKVKINRAIYCDLMELGVTEPQNGQDLFGVWSSGLFFPLGQMPNLRA